MNEEFDKTIQLISDYQQNNDVENLYKLLTNISENPKILISFYLQIKDDKHEDIRLHLQSMIRNLEFINPQFISENGDLIQQIYQNILDGIDLPTMTSLFHLFVSINSDLIQYFQPFFKRMGELTINNFPHVVSIYHLITRKLITNLEYRNCIPLYEFTTERFNDFFNINFFQPENIEFLKILPSFIQDVLLVISNSLDIFMESPDDQYILNSIFSFISQLPIMNFPNSLSSDATKYLGQIIRKIRSFISNVIRYDERFPKAAADFREKYCSALLEMSIETAKNIFQCFPHDLYRIIPYNILLLIHNLVSLSPQFYQQYFSDLFDLAYLYAALPNEYQNQYHDNPIFYYLCAYTMPDFVTTKDPRSFSFITILELFKICPQETLALYFQHPPNGTTMAILGCLCEYVFENQQNSGFVQQVAERVKYFIENFKICPEEGLFFEDKFYFMTQVSYILAPQLEELCIVSAGFLQEFEQGLQNKNITSYHQFHFTLACRAINRLFSIQCIPQGIIELFGFISRNCQYCFTSDAIMILYQFCQLSEDNFLQFGTSLFTLTMEIISQLTQGFRNSVDSLDDHEQNLAETLFSIISDCLQKHNSVIPIEPFRQFLTRLVNPGLDSDNGPITEWVTLAAENDYSDTPALLVFYFNNFSQMTETPDTDRFLNPFLIFIQNHTQEFLTWDQAQVFIQFILESFCELLTTFSNREIDDEFENLELIYYFSQAVCMLILIPGCLNNDVLQQIVGTIIQPMQKKPEFLMLFVFFDIITSIIYRQKTNPFPERILQLLINFIIQGYVFRKSDRTRYLAALEISLPNAKNEKITRCRLMLLNGIPKHKIYEDKYDWFLDQPSIGLNSEPPFGYETSIQ